MNLDGSLAVDFFVITLGNFIVLSVSCLRTDVFESSFLRILVFRTQLLK